jgi:hypothetical protein
MIVLASPTRVASGSQLDHENPWPGLASYDETSHHFFSGRAAEGDELLRRIIDEPVSVLFGKSGLGKTSLLSAGVFPRLRDRDLLPILVRLSVREASEPLIEQVRRRLLDELRSQGVEYAEPKERETLWEYLHRTSLEFWTKDNRLVRPVFVFDQFEELFTLGRAVPAHVEAFREDLADLAENRIPAALVRRHDDAFAGQSGLNPRAMTYRIVIALREDFLADLESWRAVMPSLRRNRMRLLPMRPDQALEAVCNEHTGHLVSEPLARTVVTFLSSCSSAEEDNEETVDATPSVEPALLSLFCRGLNEHRKREGKTAFDPELLEGAKGTIVKDFYLTSLADQPPRVRRFIEDDLITESGFRNSYSMRDAVGRGTITTSELATLVNRHLLRHEHHLGADRVELTHDLLTKVVLEERDRRRRMEMADRDWRQRWKFRGIAALFAVIAVVFAILAAREHSASATASAERDTASAERDKASAERDKARKARGEATTALEQRNQALKQAEAQAQIARRERDRANAESSRSRSRELAAQAEATMDKDPELAIALGLEGMKQAETAEARSALIKAARYAWPYADLRESDLGGIPRALALNRDGSRLAVLAGANAISVWDVTLRKPAKVWPSGSGGSAGLSGSAREAASSVAFSPDQKLIAVGRRTGVDLLDANTGQLETPLRQFSEYAEDRRIVFSPDGQWLASTLGAGQHLLLVDYINGQTRPLLTASHTIGGFAVLPGGSGVITVSAKPLAAYKLTLENENWTESKIDVTSCLRPHSVSPGAEYVSATWSMTACIHPVDPKRRPTPSTTEDGVTVDIVWSTGGAAFVEVLAGLDAGSDLVVGRRNGAGRLESRIKGSHPMRRTAEKSRLVSVSEAGTRVALIDDDDHKLVRIYSVAGYKPFLSDFESAFAVAPNGKWIAMARPEVGVGEQRTALDVIPIDQAFTPNQLARVSRRITVNRRLPNRLYASPDSLVVVHAADRDTHTPPTTSVFDLDSGKLRFEPLSGTWLPLGLTGEMLLSDRGRPMRVVRTRDGAALEEWEASPGVEDIVAVRMSQGKEALAVFRRSPPKKGPINVTLYSIRGDRLVRTGQVTNVPSMSSGVLIAGVLIAEDARSLTYRGRVWHVTKAAAVQSPAGTAGSRPVSAVSPRGRFEIQQDLKEQGDGPAYRIIRRSDRSVIATSPYYRFSADDRWLAAWDKDLTVFDLSRGEAIFRVEDVQDAVGDPDRNLERVEVNFAGQGVLHVRSGRSSARDMLIPLDWPVMERFLKWLTSRELSDDEACIYGLRGKECFNDARVGAGRASQ